MKTKERIEKEIASILEEVINIILKKIEVYLDEYYRPEMNGLLEEKYPTVEYTYIHNKWTLRLPLRGISTLLTREQLYRIWQGYQDPTKIEEDLEYINNFLESLPKLLADTDMQPYYNLQLFAREIAVFED